MIHYYYPILLKFLLTPGIFLGVLLSQTFSESVPVHTYSIVAYDEETGELGVAVQSHWFSVGSLVPWAKAGVGAVVSLFAGVIVSFAVGAVIAYAFGYTDAVSLTTIGAGAATYIVGPVTGAAIGASSEVIALSIAAGLVKSMLVMTGTPFVAKAIGLNNPKSAMVFGGLMGTTSGVAGGLAATDKRLVPYGAMTATFYTGLGCLLGPSVIYITVRTIVG